MLMACSSNGAATGSPAASAAGAASGARTEPTITPGAPAVTPTAANLPAFACADASGGTTSAVNVTAVRAGEDNGFDRFVLQFDSTALVPTYTVKRQTTARFTADASGQPITLDGNFGVLVHVTPSTEHDTYTGATDFKHPEFSVLKEARLVGDFEGNVSWGLGLSRGACMRAFTLSNPARLVIDFTTA